MSVSISVELLNDPPPLLPPQVNLVVFFEIEDNFNSDAISQPSHPCQTTTKIGAPFLSETLRSGVADYNFIFLNILYDIIFQ
jgi:hypothetical protein